MTRSLVVDDAAQDEAEAQAAYYFEHAGQTIALAFVAELEAIYRGLLEGRLVGVNHARVKFRLPIKRVLLDRFPYAVVFFVEADTIRVIAIEALRRRPGYWRSRLRGDENVTLDQSDE